MKEGKKTVIMEFPAGTPAEEKIKATEGYIRKEVIVYPDKVIYVLEKEKQKEEVKEPKTRKITKSAKRSSSL